MKTIFRLVIFFIILIFIVSPLVSGTKIVVSTRVYEGFGKEAKKSDSVVSTIYLEKLAAKPMFSGVAISKEKETLMRIFHLTDVKIVTEATMRLQQEGEKKRARAKILDGRDLLLQLTAVDESKDLFEVEVSEKGKQPGSLLESRVLLPATKTAVLGFEGSAGKIYFLSLHREKISYIKKPKLVYKVEPVFPPEVKDEKIEGKVILEGVTDLQGRVVKVKVIQGHPKLAQAAKEALLQWRYEPYIVDGTPKPVKFTVAVKFALDEKKEKKEK